MRDPRSGKTDRVEYTDTSVVKPIMGGRANVVELVFYGKDTVNGRDAAVRFLIVPMGAAIPAASDRRIAGHPFCAY